MNTKNLITMMIMTVCMCGVMGVGVSASELDEVAEPLVELEDIISIPQITTLGATFEVVEVMTPDEKAWAAEVAICEAAPYNVPDGTGVCNSSAITYMSYTAVTSTGSLQYKLLNGSDAWSDPETGIRMIGDRYCIAVGSGYASVGDKVDLVMANGSIIKCIVGDAKANVHTDSTNRYHTVDGSVAEMIVDYTYFNKGYNYYGEEIKGKILKVVKIEDY